MDNQIHS